ncbi:MAG: squalene/phytoene synthase family protein [Pseudomonadota bacterium]
MLERADPALPPGIDPADGAIAARLAPVPLPADADPGAVAAAITRAAGSSFGPGMRALPAPRRRAMWALYAFARVIDDIADEPMAGATRTALLDAWRGEIAALYAGRPVSAIGRALAPSVEAYGLPREEFLLLIEGMAWDAEGPIVAPDMARLRGYTRRVAGSVGLLSMRNFGAWQGARSARFALALADALQLTNILRDVAEDAVRGRLYLPAEMLARHGVPADPARIVEASGLPGLCRDLSRLARAEFDAARAALPGHDRVAVVPALMMLGVYEATLNGLEDAGFAPLPRTRLSRRAKIAAALVGAVAPSATRRDPVSA